MMGEPIPQSVPHGTTLYGPLSIFCPIFLPLYLDGKQF